jgi:hypothetical protein
MNTLDQAAAVCKHLWFSLQILGIGEPHQHQHCAGSHILVLGGGFSPSAQVTDVYLVGRHGEWCHA